MEWKNWPYWLKGGIILEIVWILQFIAKVNAGKFLKYELPGCIARVI